MKIIAGKLKNQTINTVSVKSKKDELRPSEAIIKKSLFETLKNNFNNCFFLDLFAGTGAVGIEAFSRGASFIGFVEKNKKFYLELLKKIKKFSVPSLLLCGNCLDKVKIFNYKKITFDYIFIDPPYKYRHYQKLVERIINFNILKKNGLIIIEKSYKTPFLAKEFLLLKNLELLKEKKLGSTSLNYLKKK